MRVSLTADQIRRAPKVALHEHLDGGVRPSTVAEIAQEVGHPLPAPPDQLGMWFADAASSGSLPRYLETFEHTVAVMQRPQDLARVARESVLDLAADGVVYAELRWAPEQHLQGGLTLAETVEAVQAGIDEGRAGQVKVGSSRWCGHPPLDYPGDGHDQHRAAHDEGKRRVPIPEQVEKAAHPRRIHHA